MASRRTLLAITLLVLGATLYRMRLGVDFTDESYYVAMAVRFLRGDLPFVDELFVNQTATLITLPLLRPFYALRGTEGIILYTRILYFLFCCVLAGVGYCALQRAMDRSRALLASLIGVAFIPLNIPNLSYNTLGGGLFALSIFLGLLHLAEGSAIALAGAGLAAALSSFAYPPLLLATILLGAILVGRTERSGWLVLGLLLIGHLLVALTFLPYILRAGDRLTDAVRYSLTAHHHGGGIAKCLLVLSHLFWANCPPTLLAALLALGLAPCLPRAQRGIALVAFPLLLAGAYSRYIFPSIGFFTYFTLAGGILFLLGDRSPEMKALFWVGWVPSVAAGLITAWTSASSVANAVIGFWAAGIVTSAFLANAVGGALAQTIVLAILVAFQFTGKAFYCDADFASLTAQVPSGPFRGLYTCATKLEFLNGITRDLRRLENNEGRILFYEFPAGYLLTSMRPAANSAWVRATSLGKSCYLRYYQRHLGPRNLVFALHLIDDGYLSPIRYPPDDPLIDYLRKTHHLILRRRNYEVLQPNAPLT